LRWSCWFRSTRIALPAALALAGVAQADLTGYTVDKLLFEGDPDPVAGTISQMYTEIDLDADGRGVTIGFVDDGATFPFKVFSIQDGVVAVEVANGDPVPDVAGGLTFSDVGRPRNAAPGILAWLGLYTEASVSKSGGFLRNGVVESAFALPGMAVPGGGTIADVANIHRAVAAPAVAFGAMVDAGGPGPIAAQLVAEPAGLREVIREGTPAPAPIGGTFNGVQPWWIPALAPDRTLTFYATVSGGSVASGLFRSSPTGSLSPLVVQGDAVTTPGGGSFDDFFQVVGGNSQGDIVFATFLDRPPLVFTPQAVFVLEDGVQREIVVRGDAIPGSSPARFYRQLAGSGPPALNVLGTVAFVGLATDVTEQASEPHLLVDLGDGIEVLAKAGDPVPDVVGATFTGFGPVRIADDGGIAFIAYTTGGTGAFLATPPNQIEALPPFGLMLLALVLTAVSAYYGQHGRRQA
jgi:hypothetical protein